MCFDSIITKINSYSFSNAINKAYFEQLRKMRLYSHFYCSLNTLFFKKKKKKPVPSFC